MEPTVKLQEDNSSCNQFSIDDITTKPLCEVISTFEYFIDNTSKDMFCVTGLDGKFRFVNSNFCLALGYTRSFLLSNPYSQFIHKDDLCKTANEVNKILLKHKSLHKFHNRYLKANGEIIYLEWVGTYDVNRKCILATAKDITEKIIKEQELWQKEIFLDYTKKIANLGFWSFNFISEELSWSKEMYEIFEIEHSCLSFHEINNNYSNVLRDNSARWSNLNLKKIQVQDKQTTEKKIQLHSGKVKWIKETTEKIYDRTGKLIRIDGISQDISESKFYQETIIRIIEEREMLIKELHHRVKNNMQVISSMLNLQAHSITDNHLKSIFTDSQQRIKSMATVHDLLYQSANLNTIDFKNYLENLVNGVVNTFKYPEQKIQIKIKTDNIEFSLEKAIPLGLLINELTTNTVKHGFCVTTKGEISIELYTDNYSKHVLIYKDNGKGFESAKNIQEQNFGMELLENLVEQLEGKIYRKSDKRGTIYKLTF